MSHSLEEEQVARTYWDAFAEASMPSDFGDKPGWEELSPHAQAAIVTGLRAIGAGELGALRALALEMLTARDGYPDGDCRGHCPARRWTEQTGRWRERLDATAQPARAHLCCPECGAPEPFLHPAAGAGGEVTRLCPHPYHASAPVDSRVAAALAGPEPEPDPVDTTNTQLVGANGHGEITMLMLRARMTAEEALVHAAWLVAVADRDGTRFPAILKAVLST